MSARLIVALVAFVLAVAGHASDAPGVLVLGLAGFWPLAVKVFCLPKRGRDAFVLTAVGAGLGLGVFAGVHTSSADAADRPVPVASTVGVSR